MGPGRGNGRGRRRRLGGDRLLSKLGWRGDRRSRGGPEEADYLKGARRFRDHRPQRVVHARQAARQGALGGGRRFGRLHDAPPICWPRPATTAPSRPAGSRAAWTCRPRWRPLSCAASRCSGWTASWPPRERRLEAWSRLDRDLDRAKLGVADDHDPVRQGDRDRQGDPGRNRAGPRGGGDRVTVGGHVKCRHGLKTKTPPVAPRRRRLSDPLPESSSWRFGSRLPRRDGRPQNSPEDDGADQRECRAHMAIMLSRCIQGHAGPPPAVHIALTLAASACSASPFVAAAQRM